MTGALATCDPAEGGGSLAPPGENDSLTGPELGGGIVVAVDADPFASPANTATSLGSREECASVGTGGPVYIDVTVDSIPELDELTGGLTGLEFKLTYDPQLVSVTGSNHSMLLAANGGSLVPFSDVVPDSDGSFLVAVADFGSATPETGDGVLARIAVEALAEGTAWLGLEGVALVDGFGNEYSIGTTLDGCLHIGGT